MKRIVMCLILGTVVSLSAQAAASEHRPSGWRWVTVANDGGVSNGNVRFERGGSCGVEGGRIVELRREGDALRLRFDAGTQEPRYGTRCPSGTEFQMTPREYGDMVSERHEAAEYRSAELALVRSATGVQRGTSTVPVRTWQWVTVANEAPIRSVNATLRPGTSCGIDRPGTSTVLRERGGKVLLRYDTSVRAYGSMCPSGTLYLLPAVAD